MGQIRVLIGDHTDWARNLLRSYLDAHPDINVLGVAPDGEAVLRDIKTLRPDILILELVLPLVDGLGVLERLQGNSPLPRILVFSSVAADGLIDRALALGADYYLVKPIPLELLVARVREVSGERRSAPIRETAPAADAETLITEFIHNLGIPANLSGHRYLRQAIAMILAQQEPVAVTKRLYPDIARLNGTTPSRVERAIRHAIEVAWNRCDSDLLQATFGNSILRARGRATNAEFIYTVADRLQSRIQAC